MSGYRSCSGRLFHSVGPAVAKQRSSNWLRDLLTNHVCHTCTHVCKYHLTVGTGKSKYDWAAESCERLSRRGAVVSACMFNCRLPLLMSIMLIQSWMSVHHQQSHQPDCSQVLHRRYARLSLAVNFDSITYDICWGYCCGVAFHISRNILVLAYM